MTPKGGIKPHNRFSVQSKRSEVLFVDYMAEHLTPGGRAGIIVPEGIIFQSQTAYKKLRKMLVEDSLVAVVSLPQGVFNPYSGVKTSILILDKSRAKRSSEILFVRIDDDGHDLGVTRKVTGEGDLPEAGRLLKKWFKSIDSADSPSAFSIRAATSLLVSRQEIAESVDYRLTADSYRKIENCEGSTFRWVPLGYLLGPRTSNRVGDDQSLPVLSITMKHGLVDQADKFKKRIASVDISSYKKVARNELVVGFPIDEGVLGIQTQYPFASVSPAYDVWEVIQDRLELPFFDLLLRSHQARSRYRIKMRGTAGRRRTLDKSDFLQIEFPLPPLDVQKEIVAEIEGYQKVIDGARSVLDNYRPHIPIHPDWPMVPLEEICEIKRGKFSYRPRNEPRFYGGKYPFIQTGDIVRANGGKINYTQTLNDDGLSVSKLFQPPVVVITIAANIGDTAVLDFPSCFPDSVVGLIPKSGTDTRFLELAMRTKKQHLNDIAPQSAQKNKNIEILKTVKISLPPLATQQAIVAQIEAEQTLVDANSELITRFEKKIQATLARVWGEGKD
jgi:type I restriction enzyme M protein